LGIGVSQSRLQSQKHPVVSGVAFTRERANLDNKERDIARGGAGGDGGHFSPLGTRDRTTNRRLVYD
jgi:hypothetical protein